MNFALRNTAAAAATVIAAILMQVATVTPAAGAKVVNGEIAFEHIQYELFFACRKAPSIEAPVVGIGDPTCLNYENSEFTPKWSPDGSKIAYVLSGDPNKIEIVSSDGGASYSREIEPPNRRNFGSDTLSWSNDGSSLAVAVADSLYTVTSLERSPQFSYTAEIDRNTAVAWSPVNSQIAYTFGGDIFVTQPDGTGNRKIVDYASGKVRNPSWSPDGSEIVFDLARGCADLATDIYRAKVDGSAPATRLTSDSEGREDCGGAREPDWSPDGSKIVYSSDANSTAANKRGYDLYTMNTDGSSVEVVTNYEGNDQRPDWQQLQVEDAPGGNTGGGQTVTKTTSTTRTVTVVEDPTACTAKRIHSLKKKLAKAKRRLRRAKNRRAAKRSRRRVSRLQRKLSECGGTEKSGTGKGRKR